MKKLKVLSVIGTRPEIIRLSRVLAALDEYCEHILVHTGQNYDYELNEIFFKEEFLKILDIQDDKEPEDQILIDLIRESGDKYIETDYIVDLNGNQIPDPLTKEEVRDAKIDIINDKFNNI